MAQFHNDDLEYMVHDYSDAADFEDDPFGEAKPLGNDDFESVDSDFEDDFEVVCFLSFYFSSPFFQIPWNFIIKSMFVL